MHCLCERKMVQPLWKTVGRFLKKLNTELPYDPESLGHVWMYTQNNCKLRLKKLPVYSRSQQYYSQ